MYRQYENPYDIDRMLQQARIELLLEDDEYAKELIHERIADLESRLNYAWQDDEYDMMGYYE